MAAAMPDGSALAGAIIQVGTAAVALYGAWRCVRLQRFASDSRLKALAVFFALFAAGVALHAAWQVEVGAPPPPGPWGTHAGYPMPSPANATLGPRDHDLFRPEGDEQVNILLAASQALTIASLVVAVWAFGHRRQDGGGPALPPAALAVTPFVVLGTLVPLMLALEAGLALYLAARALVNHVEQRSAGALQVALGFLLFFAANLVIYLAHEPGWGHDRLGDVLGLVGIVLLVQALPGKR